MLILSRKIGERIVIGDGVMIEVIDIANGKVRLGVVADKNIPVHRLEVWEALWLGEPKKGDRE